MSAEHATGAEPLPDGAGGGRRHDLDALRATAMLLGVALHAALSFVPAPWPAQDSRQSDLFTLAVAAVHGFRMPLFFLLSGYFTAMVFRRRGLGPLLRRRAARLLVPCLLGLLTVVPLMRLASAWAMETAPAPAVAASGEKWGIGPLAWAALRGDAEAVTRLLDAGTDVNDAGVDGTTALHGAAFLGHHAIAEELLRRGADPVARTGRGDTPFDSLNADWETTDFLMRLIGLPVPDRAAVEQGRERVRRLIEPWRPKTDVRPPGSSTDPLGLVRGYRTFLDSDRFLVEGFGGRLHLFNTDVFNYLWFLWYLCWLVALFGATVRVAPGVLNLSPWWAVPLTLVPQWFMGAKGPEFGPGTATGVLPPPHLLGYYGLFFGFGVLLFGRGGAMPGTGRRWWAPLLVGLLVAFPMGLVSISFRPVTAPAQTLYAWTMCFGLIGLFRALRGRERLTVRYLSDASYWLYLSHLPLVVAAQAVVRDWPLPALVKFAGVCAAVVGPLLLVYHLVVRRTWLGVLLDGRRTSAAPLGA